MRKQSPRLPYEKGRSQLVSSKLARLLLAALLAVIALIAPSLLSHPPISLAQAQLLSSTPASARQINPATLATEIYGRLPDLPLENQYISRETGQPDLENTLVSRIIRYHVYIQKRPTHFRLDWKLTLADYLDAFEPLSADRYPALGLRENPMAGDRAVVQSLDPLQRDRLVNTLYETFTAPPAPPAQSPESPAISL